jgi:hypothetical protein
MQGTSGGRDLKARYYCATSRANRSCDQPIFPTERVEQQLAQFLTGFAPNKATQTEILHRAVQPKPSFLPFFQRARRPVTGEAAGVKYGSDGTRTRDLCRDRAAL